MEGGSNVQRYEEESGSKLKNWISFCFSFPPRVTETPHGHGFTKVISELRNGDEDVFSFFFFSSSDLHRWSWKWKCFSFSKSPPFDSFFSCLDGDWRVLEGAEQG